METLTKMKELFDKAMEIWAKIKPIAAKVGPNGAWFAAGFAAAKLASCLLN